MTKIALANDYPLLLSSISAIINKEPGITVCATFNEPDKLVDWYNGMNADILVFDYRTPSFDGLGAGKQILKRFPFASILLLSVSDDPGVATSLKLSGIRAWLNREANFSNLIHIIKSMNGDLHKAEDKLSTIKLSKREADIVECLSAGKTTPDIANELNLSPLTVKTHRQNILRKYQVSNTVQLFGKINSGVYTI